MYYNFKDRESVENFFNKKMFYGQKMGCVRSAPARMQDPFSLQERKDYVITENGEDVDLRIEYSAYCDMQKKQFSHNTSVKIKSKQDKFFKEILFDKSDKMYPLNMVCQKEFSKGEILDEIYEDPEWVLDMCLLAMTYPKNWMGLANSEKGLKLVRAFKEARKNAPNKSVLVNALAKANGIFSVCQRGGKTVLVTEALLQDVLAESGSHCNKIEQTEEVVINK